MSAKVVTENRQEPDIEMNETGRDKRLSLLMRTDALHYVFTILTFGFTHIAISDLTAFLVTRNLWQSANEILKTGGRFG
jgi:hypothetical protein